MKKSLDFKIPFSCFAGATFINCFASAYIYLEKIDNGKLKGTCQKDTCGVCEVYFLFDTMCGHSSIRWRFDGEPTEMQKLIGDYRADCFDCGTDYTVDFLFGFAGYEFRQCTDSALFKNEIIASIDADRPIIARVKSENGLFRVITGYDDDSLITPDYANAQNKPESNLSYDELEILYVVGDKITPRYTLKDGLERIREVMEYNINENLWDGYIEKMYPWIIGSDETNPEERKARMQRLTEAMRNAWNSWCFAETFRHCYYEELRNPAFSDLWEKISEYGFRMCDYGHAINYLNGVIDWSIDLSPLSGISEMIWKAIETVKNKDIEMLGVIKQAIEILDKK